MRPCLQEPRVARISRPEPFVRLTRKRCHGCGSVVIYLSHFPRRHRYICEPCYWLAVRPKDAVRHIVEYFDSPYRAPRYRFGSALRECIGWLLRRTGIGILRRLGLL